MNIIHFCIFVAMETLVTPFINRLDDIKKDLPNIARGILLEHKKEILSLIQDSQLGKGLDSSGNLLIHPSKRNSGRNIGIYEPVTENFFAKISPIPRKNKKAGSTYNFEWTGNTFDGMDFGAFTDETYTIISRSGKAMELENIYGTKLFDLTEENNEYINVEILIPKLYEYILTEGVRGLI